MACVILDITDTERETTRDTKSEKESKRESNSAIKRGGAL